MENKRTKYLMKNTIIFAIGNFTIKFITFFLVPFYTHLLTKKQYGIVDLIYTISIVIIPIITLNISESVMRFCLDKDDKEKQIISIANKMFIISLLIMLVGTPIFSIFSMFKGIELLISLYIISTCGSQLYLLVIKGQERLKLYTIGNVINTFLIAALNILFLAVFKMGIEGYLMAYIISNFITMIYALIISKSYKIGINNYDKKLFSSMVKYSIVLIPTSFMWWIMNSSDRIMISNMVSTSANGIYAVSYKLPTLISTIISIFNQAWLFSAIKEIKSKDKDEYTNKIYKMLYTISIMSGLGLIMITKIFMKYYVSKEFYEAWKYMSFLTIGVIFQSLATFLSTSYNVYKDNKGFLYSGVAGAILNIILNFLLIPKFKIYGAAVATCASYIMVFIYRYFDTKKYIKINAFTIKNIIGFILLIASTAFLYIDYKYSQFIQILIFLTSIIVYKEEILKIIDSIFKNKIIKAKGVKQ